MQLPLGAALLIGSLAGPVSAAAAPDKPLLFNRDIKPVLIDNCFSCHGPDPGTRKAGLRLDTEAGLFGDRKSGKVIVKGKPGASLLYQRISTEDEDDVMPPPKSHKQLSAAQKDLLKRWIEQGAPWQAHWSFIAPQRAPLPAVKNKAWARNPIDAFILARLEEKGLAPAAEADRRTLIRRLALDLTGLPPDPNEVEAFVADQSPGAYDKIVDLYLARPQWGEHRARYWLDAARYADTHGLHFDNYREIWPYRDWVIGAFNQNMPFDRFTVEQLAGDLLPNRTTEQQIASGFNRCAISTNEGGTIAEENLVLYTRDRTETTARVFLGLTANCAVCHDHKFDPITARDFYSMSAFFNNTTQGALDGNIKDTPPVLVVPAEQDRGRWTQLASEVLGLKKKIEQRKSAAKAEFDRWVASADAASLAQGIPGGKLRLHAPLDEGQGTTTRATIDGVQRAVPLASSSQWQAGHIAPHAVAATGAGAPVEFPDAGDFDRNQPFTCAVWAKLPGKVTGAIVGRMSEKDAYRGWDLWVEQDRIGTHIIHHWDDNAIKVVSNKPVDPGKWHHFVITYDGSSKAAGVRIYVDGQPQPARPMADRLSQTTRTNVPLKVGQRNNSSPIKGLIVQDLRLYGRALDAAEVKQLALSTRLAGTIAKPAAKRSDAEKKDLFDWYLSSIDSPSKEMATSLAAMEREENAIRMRGAVTLVTEEKPQPASAFILFRGEYDKRRDEVKPATPSFLPPMPESAPRNRLGFAQWLVRPENPLMARVTVNRFWQEIFGNAIVKTTEDFGVMGESPSHPELLDWLAVEFRESGWDVKGLFRLIVTSATYRQAAVATPEKLEKDPENRLLSRGPRFRMDGEMVRDSALCASGLLAKRIGGPSVRPYQPPGIWEAVAMPGSTTRTYTQDKGENLYRRSMYTFWKRAAPPASMETFNAPSREVCTVRRERTNTPLQALITMNDPQFVEAARNLAQTAIKSGGSTFASRASLVAGRLLARPLRSEESAILRAAHGDLLAYYKDHKEDAVKLLSVGESKRDESIDPADHAAWTMVVNQMMNLDEALNK